MINNFQTQTSILFLTFSLLRIIGDCKNIFKEIMKCQSNILTCIERPYIGNPISTVSVGCFMNFLPITLHVFYIEYLSILH
jgi:hypothetical protein